MNPDAILVRSAKINIEDIDENVKAIGRAGVGVDNIPIADCTKLGIPVFNTPRANSNSVKELVLLGMIMASRNIKEAIKWIDKMDDKDIKRTVESNKNMFKGNDIKGKTIGIIGMGEIGKLVAIDAMHLGMNVLALDPFVNQNKFKYSDIAFVSSINDLFSKCDFISIHVPLNENTKGMINYDNIKNAKKGIKILNFSRDGIVNCNDMIYFINSGLVSSYVTDFPCEELRNVKNVIMLPHLGASTYESEENCAKAVVTNVKNFIETGNINSSVNYPNINSPLYGNFRICLTHDNDKNVIHSLFDILRQNNIEIINSCSKSSDYCTYTIVDVNKINDDIKKLIPMPNRIIENV